MSFTADQLRDKGYVETSPGNWELPKFLPPTGEPETVHAPVERERDLHDRIECDLINRRWLYFHGSTAHRTMRTLGEPDFQIYGDGGRFWLIECKTAKGKLRPEQIGVAMLAEKLGHKIHVVRSFQEYLNIINTYKT